MATLETPYAPSGSDGGADNAAAGGSLTPPGLSAYEWNIIAAVADASYEPHALWVKLRLEDANEAFARSDYDKARLATDLADSMMRYLELRQREEAAS